MIYFIQAEDGTGPIKIGTSLRLALRLKTLSKEAGRPLCVLGVLKGERRKERELHRRFSDLRESGEWHSAAPRLLTFIRRYAKPWNGRNDVEVVNVTFDPDHMERIRAAAQNAGESMSQFVMNAVRRKLIDNEATFSTLVNP